MRDPFPDDEALVAALRRDDRRAWQAFLDRYERLILAVPRRMGLAPDDAADVFQDVLTAFLEGLPRLREPRTVPRWLTRTAFRLARERRRRSRREPTLAEPESIERIPDPADVAEVLARASDATRVRRLVAGLAGRCPELLGLLFFTEPEPSYAEIGRRLRIPIGSLGPTRRRCLETLLARLGEKPAARRISRPPRPTLGATGTPPPRSPTRRTR